MGKTYKYVGRRFIDLSYVCQQLADGRKVCKKERSLVHYEDETMIGLNSILHVTYLRHNFTIPYMLFRSERLLLPQLLEPMRKLLKESDRHVLYNQYWRKYAVSYIFRYLSRSQ